MRLTGGGETALSSDVVRFNLEGWRVDEDILHQIAWLSTESGLTFKETNLDTGQATLCIYHIDTPPISMIEKCNECPYDFDASGAMIREWIPGSRIDIRPKLARSLFHYEKADLMTGTIKAVSGV